MYKKLVIFIALLLSGSAAVLGQDIIRASAIVLPEYPYSSIYEVNSGQTVKISSGQSVTLTPGAWLKEGSNVTIRIGNSPIYPSAPDNTTSDLQMNWIYTKTRDENMVVNGESKIFSDNYGNLLQTQVKNMSTGHIIATQPLYDAFGRSVGQTLPAPVNNSGFSYKSAFVTRSTGAAYDYKDFDGAKTNNPDAVANTTIGTLGWYYSNNNTFDPYVPATGFPYDRSDFYKDGSGMSKRSASIGEQLKMGMGREGRSYTMPVSRELDKYFEIRNKYFTDAQIGERPSVITGQAVQQIAHDVNGKEAVSITDRSGNTLMTARPGTDLTTTNTVSLYPNTNPVIYFKVLEGGSASILAGTKYRLYDMNADEQLISMPGSNILPAGYYKLVDTGVVTDEVRLQYINKFSDISYNFYNQAGQLLASIAPNGVKKLIDEGLTGYPDLQSLPFVTTYEYDVQGRLIANNQTDAGRTEFIYRQDGNIRFSQNSVQRAASPARFSYINYDRWGRAVESGEYVQGSILFASTRTNTALLESKAAGGGLTGGTKQAVVKTEYDVPNTTHGQTALGYVQDESFLRGAVSYTENADAKTWYNYDSEGRVSWVIKEYTGLTGKKTVDYTYDANGNVSKVDFQKDIAGERFTHEYEYDADGRLKVAYTSTSTSGKKEQARYYYYLHGPLKRVELADNLQGIDYTYTAQGMLKTINHPVTANDPGKDDGASGISPDAFGMSLEYFSGDYARSATNITSLATGGTADYSGSIMGQSWRSQKPQAVVNAYGAAVNNPAMVTYAYNNKYQFDSNKFGAPNFGSNNFTETVNANREYGLSYDPNGNIMALNRTNAAGTATANYGYTYQAKTNKLTAVSGYATSYTYDALGQMISQVRTAGSQGYYVDYNVNGKVTAIYSNAAKTTLRVSFGYDESGNRIRKTDHIQNTVTYYVNDASGNLLAVYDNKGTAMGQKEVPIYASSRLGMYKRDGNSYQYELTDHLGNVRVVLNGIKQGNGQADVVYYSDYYPYGSPLTLAANDYRYGYQGQYAEVDKETGWNNFELRMYDPAIGRWMSTDPKKQYDSPYVGMGNNPVSSVDPDGGETENQGIDKNGNIIFDDYEQDGNVFLLKDGFEGKVNNLDQLKANSTQIVKSNVFIGTDEQLGFLVKSQWQYAEGGFSGFVFTNRFEVNGNAGKNSLSVAPFKSRGGKDILMATNEMYFTINNIKGSENHILGNVYNIRNSIAHEKDHIRKYTAMYHADFVKKNFMLNRGEWELEAIDYQRTVPSWKKTTNEYKAGLSMYEDRWRR